MFFSLFLDHRAKTSPLSLHLYVMYLSSDYLVSSLIWSLIIVLRLVQCVMFVIYKNEANNTSVHIFTTSDHLFRTIRMSMFHHLIGEGLVDT